MNNFNGNTEIKYDLFVSYSREDMFVVKEVVQSLREQKLRIWMDLTGVESGDRFKAKIVEAIDNSLAVLFFSSVTSNRSTWVVNEVGVAMAHHKTVIPIRLDSSIYNPQIELDLVNINYHNYYFKDRSQAKLATIVKSVCHKLELLSSGKKKSQNTETPPPPPPPPHSHTGTMPPPPPPVQSSFLTRKFMANYDAGMLNVQGGQLVISGTSLTFNAHQFNVGDTSSRTWAISQICGYRRSFPRFLTVFFNDGRSAKFVLWNRHEVYNELENRRKFLFQNKGMPVPPLMENR